MMHNFDPVELRRMSQDNGKLFITYVIDAKKFEQVSNTKEGLIELVPEAAFSFVYNKNMIG